ncbi:MAG: glycosyltransferase family 9 protein [Bacteroidetes bacterium]|nr:glycosyltransferase family 9 protein [Bacteroidota bacterium]
MTGTDLEKRITKILVTQFMGIGNLFLSIPFLKNLRREFPGVKILLFARSKEAGRVLMSSHLVDDLIISDFMPTSSKNFLDWRFWWSFLSIVKIFRIEKPNVVFFLYPNLKFWLPFAAMLGGVPLRVGHRYLWKKETSLFLTHYTTRNPGIHEVQQNLQLLQLLGIEARDEKMDIALPQLSVNLINNGWINIGIHPGSGNGMRIKRWDINNFIELAKRLTNKFENLKIHFFIGPEDKDLLKSLNTLRGSQNIFILKPSSLIDAIQNVIMCSLFVTNDTGLMHVARICNKSVVSLFGPTSENVTGPWPLDDPGIYIINKKLYCSPCYIHGKGKFNIVCDFRIDCLVGISVEEIFRTVEDAILKIII